jgi:type III restriction enzyme
LGVGAIAVIDNRALSQVRQRLSLRKPQTRSLEILADIVDHLVLRGAGDDADRKIDINVAEALEIIQRAYPNVEDFERDFVSLCFALATGVGKTRLMGAFIAYLYKTGISRNFFVLAPNLTIYEKLLSDFQPSSPKYVFKGIEEFANLPPLIVNAENYEEGRGVRGADLLGREAAIINIFNISKINSEVRGGRSPRIKRLQEYIGESYFQYLSNLPDLVMLMDEAHRYRGTAGWNAINELKPILGIEVTATPKSVGAGSRAFRNVIYDYTLPEAMEDGYVKEPAVGTRPNFDPKSVTDDVLERIKLEDGIHYHEHVKVQLQTYARQNEVKRVHPFMLVVATDIDHAEDLKRFIESADFFEGRYAGRVITVHSGKSGVESDETAEKLLAVEHSGATDIVIHVNKLKEGWDVTNLYTIVPLRASASDILTEQTLGRGLRLPYGRRTGVDAVDTLTVIAHDRFNEIIERAKTSEVVIKKTITIGDGGDVPKSSPVMIETKSLVEEMLYPTRQEAVSGGGNAGVREQAQPAFTFNKQEEIALAATALKEVLPHFQSRVRTLKDITKTEVVAQIADAALRVERDKDGLFESVTAERAKEIVRELCEVFAEKTIAVPQIVLTPTDQVSFGFEKFQLQGLNEWNYQPISKELLVQVLRTEQRSLISSAEGGERESDLRNYIVARLIDFDEIDYDAHAELLYDLAGQVLDRLRSYLTSEDDIHNVLITRAKEIAKTVLQQMREHMRRTQTTYRVSTNAAFTMLKPQAYDGSGKDAVRDVRNAPERLSDIKRYVFRNFKKGCYPFAKFDSDPERRLALLLDHEPSVLKWMKPAPNQFRIEDADGHPYQPDFVVETETERLILEPKRRDLVDDPDVQRKARAAILWCHIASDHHATANGEKPWRYALIPDDQIQASATLNGLLSAHSKVADTELRARYEIVSAAA